MRGWQICLLILTSMKKKLSMWAFAISKLHLTLPISEDPCKWLWRVLKAPWFWLGGEMWQACCGRVNLSLALWSPLQVQLSYEALRIATFCLHFVQPSLAWLIAQTPPYSPASPGEVSCEQHTLNRHPRRGIQNGSRSCSSSAPSNALSQSLDCPAPAARSLWGSAPLLLKDMLTGCQHGEILPGKHLETNPSQMRSTQVLPLRKQAECLSLAQESIFTH